MAWKIGEAIVLEHYASIYRTKQIGKSNQITLYTTMFAYPSGNKPKSRKKKKGRKARREGRIIG